jgi:uncharacterized protein (DUF362 family)
MPEEINTRKFNLSLTRRQFLLLTAGVAGSCFLGYQLMNSDAPVSKVAVVPVAKYSLNIKEILRPYFNQFQLSLNGKNVLLKPNIVDYHGNDHYIITNPDILKAAIELFKDAGAHVVIAEASGLRRDINTILHYSHYKEILQKYNVEFVDLNMDNVVKTKIPSNLTSLEYLYIPETIKKSDFIVSMPKLKTHHWMGVTISLKNMFGIMPGIKYGWPKNKLHYAGVERSIIDINYTVRPDFTIIDGVYGIEGNGPIFGDNKHLGIVIMSNDLVAADYVAAKCIGVNPEKVTYLKLASLPLNPNLSPLGYVNKIIIIGEQINHVRRSFKLLDEFKHLRL